MQFVPTNLGNGVLGTVSATLYTVPVDATAMMRSVVLVNKTAMSVELSLRVKIGAAGTARNMIPPNMRLGPYSKFDDNSVIVLPTGSTIEGEANTGSAIDFIISGVIAS